MFQIFRSKFVFLISILIIILFLVLLNSKNVLDIPKSALNFCASPVQKILKGTSDKTGNFFRFLGTIKNLNQENEALKKENKKLAAEITELKELSWENKLLRKQLDLSPREDLKLISSFIIGKGSPELGQYFIINKGRNKGIKKNQAVIASSNILVGKVIEVSSNTSKILLITDINSLLNAIIQETRVSGIVKGEHGLGLIMEMIPRDEKINSGETIITSGLEGFFPKGLLIGEIKEVISSSSGIFQKAIIEPAINAQELEMVFIVSCNL
jgi:rod shape-determining protein MreC